MFTWLNWHKFIIRCKRWNHFQNHNSDLFICYETNPETTKDISIHAPVLKHTEAKKRGFLAEGC
jgi:hypothetical protein